MVQLLPGHGLGLAQLCGATVARARAGLGAVVGRRHAIPGCCAGHVAMPLQLLGSVCPPLRRARGHKANCWWGPGGCCWGGPWLCHRAVADVSRGGSSVVDTLRTDFVRNDRAFPPGISLVGTKRIAKHRLPKLTK